MKEFILFLLVIIVIGVIYIRSQSKSSVKKASLIQRFKNRFRYRNRLREKLSEKLSNTLMADPEANIAIGSWYSETELREKADIHRARLSKYGRSKMNGEMLFLGPKGGVYKYNSEGNKKYL